MLAGKSFKEAMEAEGSISLAERFGGKLERDNSQVLPGYKPYPKDLVDLYSRRIRSVPNKLERSLEEITDKLKQAGITDDSRVDVIAQEYYALDPRRADVGHQYLASAHTQAMVDQSPQRQVEKHIALASERGIPMDGKTTCGEIIKLLKMRRL